MTLLWDGAVYEALAGGATKAVFAEELPQLSGCGNWTRTSDLQLMGLASYRLLYPAILTAYLFNFPVQSLTTTQPPFLTSKAIIPQNNDIVDLKKQKNYISSSPFCSGSSVMTYTTADITAHKIAVHMAFIYGMDEFS